MLKYAFNSRRNLMAVVCASLTVALMLFAPLSAAAGTQSEDYQARRKRAFELIDQSKFDEARQIFEALSKENSQDASVAFGLGFTTFAVSKSIKDAEERRKARMRARQAFVRAKTLGFENEFLDSLISVIPPDGSEGRESTFSENVEADKAMHEGEALFTRGELDAAIAAYGRAFKLDPQLYEAPLFIGDMYRRKKDVEKAGEWFAKAIAIDPNRETAYRYWGDILMSVGRMKEARDKFIEAIIAAPYSQMTWEGGLIRWAEEAGVRLGHPKIEVPAGISSSKQGEVNITIDPNMLGGKEDGSSAWLVYSITRANWRTAKFAKTFPKETAYRHSLAEEADALSMVVASVKADKKIKSMQESLANLVKLNDAGLLEAYILLVRADEGIVKDYEEYRRINRDKLRKYLTDIVVGPFNRQGTF
ncbi:MAG TPA: tetratricopeptide repeat protein [Pyrinomonadaceae bacterium]|jgi:tetratricopeptide (TPR) repeat protein